MTGIRFSRRRDLTAANRERARRKKLRDATRAHRRLK
jgi:hypothetical protein